MVNVYTEMNTPFGRSVRSGLSLTEVIGCNDHWPNQALERTADRRENLLSMTSTLNREAQLALVSGRSSLSR
jgi:hypothetical protein